LPDSVTRYGAQKFGSASARPRIVSVYRGAGGWTAPPDGIRLTRGTAEELRELGYTMVRGRHRFRTHEVVIRRCLES